MKNLSLSIICLLVLSAVAGAQELPLELLYKGDEIVEIEPGAPVTAVFLLTNKTKESVAIDFEIVLPENWHLVTADSSFDVPAEDMHIILATFIAPRSTPAGPYFITVTAMNRNNVFIRLERTVSFWVQERIDVELSETETSSYLIAGQEIVNEFLVHNRSNRTVSLEIDARSSEQYPLSIHGFAGDYMTLKIGETRSITVHGQSSTEISRFLRHKTGISAFVLLPDGSRNVDYPPRRAESGTDILPKNSVAGNRYNQIPVFWSLVQANKFGAAYTGNAALRLSGNGS